MIQKYFNTIATAIGSIGVVGLGTLGIPNGGTATVAQTIGAGILVAIIWLVENQKTIQTAVNEVEDLYAKEKAVWHHNPPATSVAQAVKDLQSIDDGPALPPEVVAAVAPVAAQLEQAIVNKISAAIPRPKA